MNVVIFGLGHIGFYHLREFIRIKCNILGILINTKSKIKEKQLQIKNNYNIYINIYTNLGKLFDDIKNIDIVSICTPSNTHYYYINECIKKNINIFCEKPFIINTSNNTLNTKLLLNDIINRKLKIGVNTQWVYGIDYIKNYFNIKPKNSIVISMAHSNTGLEFYSEMIPHMNSILIYLCGINRPKNIDIIKTKLFSIIRFTYSGIKVEYRIKYKKQYGSDISFVFDSLDFTRLIKDNYQQYFLCRNLKDNKVFEIKMEDPLMLTIKAFINSFTNIPLITHNDIIHNVKLLDLLLKHI